MSIRIGQFGRLRHGTGGTVNPVLRPSIRSAVRISTRRRASRSGPLRSSRSVNDPNKFYCPKTGPFSFYNPQYATLYNWRSMGTANYNAMQVTLKHAMSHGMQFDFNYTFSKSIDLASDAERVGTIGGIGGQIINAWDPYQFRAPSDFDATHQFTADFVADLPFGRNRHFASNVSRGLDAVIGGWQLSGLVRVTSASRSPSSTAHSGRRTGIWEATLISLATSRLARFHDPSDPDVVSAFSTAARLPRANSWSPCLGKPVSATTSAAMATSARTSACRSVGLCRGRNTTASSFAGKSST